MSEHATQSFADTAEAEGDRARFWRDGALEGTEFMHARFVLHHFSPHAHDEYAIGVIEEGANNYRYRGRYHLAAAGQVCLVEPGEAHTGESGVPSGLVYRMFYAPAHLFARAAEALGMRGLPHFPRTVVSDPAVASALWAMHVASERGESELERQSRFAGLVTELVARHADAKIALEPQRRRRDAPEGIRRALDFVDRSFADPLTLDELARCAGMSDFHFARVFTKATGMSPHKYVVHRRVAEACRLLRKEPNPAQVALHVGFADQAHLTRHFKRITGVTPARFARG